jgi:hypothetical protein
VTATHREWLLRHSLTDRGGFYARAMALAQSIDGRADAEGVRLAAELDSGLAIDAELGQRFLAAMLRAGWSSEGTRSDEV